VGWELLLGWLLPRTEKTFILGIDPHEATRVKRSVVVIEFERRHAIAADAVLLPADALEDGVDRIVLIAAINHLKGELNEQFPHFGMAAVKVGDLLSHLFLSVHGFSSVPGSYWK